MNYTTNYHPVISFSLDKDGKFKHASYEGEQDVNSYGFDYNIDKNGAITQRNKFRDAGRGQISAEDMTAVKSRLEELSKQSTLAY